MESSSSQRFDLTREAQDDGGYDSTNEEDDYSKASKKARYDLATKQRKDLRRHAKGDKDVLRTESSQEEMRKARVSSIPLTAYDRHKQLINTYQLFHTGSTGCMKRDTTKDQRDIDVIKKHHKFLWCEEGDGENSWEVQLARRYYDKLFKEYCIIDLSRYKENKFGMRWRIQKEVVIGKGQFVCANKKCDEVNKLRTWEVNFGYMEHGEKKNALVKCRLCGECSYKLNYTHKKKEVTKRSKKSKKSKKKKKRRDSSSSSSSSDSSAAKPSTSSSSSNSTSQPTDNPPSSKSEADIWSGPAQRQDEEKDREQVFNEFLEDLFL